MTYQDRAKAPHAANEVTAARLADANINPVTGFATDYLNHFNEAIMLLEMLPDCPDVLDDLLAWKPMSYREHFMASHFKGRDLAIAAYDAADPVLRDCLDTMATTMSAVLEATRESMRPDMPSQDAAALAEQAVAWVKPLLARASALINGEGDGEMTNAQAMADLLMKKSL
jgi:hypothetical protein